MALKPNIKSPIDAGQRAALFAALLLTIFLKELYILKLIACLYPILLSLLKSVQSVPVLQS